MKKVLYSCSIKLEFNLMRIIIVRFSFSSFHKFTNTMRRKEKVVIFQDALSVNYSQRNLCILLKANGDRVVWYSHVFVTRLVILTEKLDFKNISNLLSTLNLQTLLQIECLLKVWQVQNAHHFILDIHHRFRLNL